MSSLSSRHFRTHTGNSESRRRTGNPGPRLAASPFCSVRMRGIVLSFAFILSLVVSASAARIAAWDFTGEDNVATSAAEVYDAHLDSSPLLTRGAGAPASSGGNSFRTTGFKNDGISTANTDYFQFTLSASNGFALSLSTIDGRVKGTDTFSPASVQFAYSLNETSFTLIGSAQTITGFGGTNGTALTQINLSSISALQNVPAQTTVTFRFYATGSTSTGGFGFYSNELGSYGLDIGGTLTAVPEPTTLVGGLLAVGGICWHQRRRFAGLLKSANA